MQLSKFPSNHPNFPDKLRRLEELMPDTIWTLGDLPKGHYVGIVGTRHHTRYGEEVTYLIASELAKAGAVIVSGLALGLDGVAHRAALDAGGKTIAVLGHGLGTGTIHPTSHTAMAREILQSGGALVSQFEPNQTPARWTFPLRNRVIAAISDALVVTEAPFNSGTMLTVGHAQKCGVPIMSVPGNITSKKSAATNNLIKTGATPIYSTADVITELGFIAHESVPVPAKSREEAAILNLLGEGAYTSEDIIEQLKLTAAQFANIISLMEITGKVRNLGAGNWIRR